MYLETYAFYVFFFFFFQAEDGIRDLYVTGVQTCALPICIGKNQAGALAFIARIERHSSGDRASSSAGNRNGSVDEIGRASCRKECRYRRSELELRADEDGEELYSTV